MRTFLLTLALAAMATSGCLSDSAPGDEPGDGTGTTGDGRLGISYDPWPGIHELMAGIPCDVEAVGSGTSGNLLQLANLSYGQGDGIHAEVDIGGNLLLHARYATGGFEMVDISDPLHPEFLGNWSAEDAGGALDVKFSPDNATALYGTGNGIILADVRDPALVREVGRWTTAEVPDDAETVPGVGYNTHMLYTARIAEQDWVFIAPNANTGVWILRMDGTPDARTLTYVTRTLPVEGGPLGPHDMFVTQDEMDGNWYLYSADGFHGWTAFNVNDPANPELAGGIANPAEGAYTHTIQAQWVNGRRIVATIGEVGANALKVYDATNLRAPLFLGAWQAEPGPGSTAPEHNFNVVGGKGYLSYYTLGVYIFDFTQLSGIPVLGTAELTPVAHFGENPEQAPGPLDFSGVWDTVLKDGVVYLSNIEGGLVVVGYGCNNPLPNVALTSTG